MSEKILKQYHEKDKLEVGIDEAGRGCLFGPVCIAGVIWLDEDPDESIILKDSKKCSEKYREKCYGYIIENSISYSIKMMGNEYIDETNILQSTLDGMHECLDDISKEIQFDSILVDGTQFNTYYNGECDEFTPHYCIPKGDDKYKSIAAASILAKTARDNYILKLVEENPELEKYDIQNNKGYGTKKHMEAIKKYGVTKWHRKSFAPCNINQN
jgi:ribonuclease HII